jgi:hypothetical protein
MEFTERVSCELFLTKFTAWGRRYSRPDSDESHLPVGELNNGYRSKGLGLVDFGLISIGNL